MTWFSLSKAPLLTGFHFSFIGRPIFHGSLASSSNKTTRFLGTTLIIAIAIFHFYLESSDLLIYLNANLNKSYAEVANFKISSEDILATDSQFFSLLYRYQKTLNYEVIKVNYWKRYRNATSHNNLELLGEEQRSQPLTPDLIIISAYTMNKFGMPDSKQYKATEEYKDTSTPKIKLFGKTIKRLLEPLKPYSFRRIK